MLTKPQFWILMLLAVVLCGLSVVNVMLSVNARNLVAALKAKGVSPRAPEQSREESSDVF